MTYSQIKYEVQGPVALVTLHRPEKMNAFTRTMMAELIDAQPDLYFRPAYYGPSGWIGITLDRPRVDWSHVADRLAQSWELVAPRRLLEAGGR